MDKKRPVLVTSEEKTKLPLLIVDKQGLIGNALAKLLREQFFVVVVTAGVVEKHNNVVHVSYRRKIPMIPDNAYSHIFLVYNGEKELLDMLPAFEDKAESVKGRFIFISSLLYSNPTLYTRLRQTKLSLLQTLIYGELFENSIAEANETNFFIHQARVYGRIEVPHEGLGQLYPIYLEDVLSAIVSVAFAIERPKEPILLFPHHIYNQITVARIIQKIDPSIKVDFRKRKSSAMKYFIPQNGLYFFRNYQLEERLHKIDFSRIGKRSQLPQKIIQFKKPHTKNGNNLLGIVATVFLAVFIAPLVAATLCALLGIGLTGLSIKQAEKGSLAGAGASAHIAEISFSTAQALGPSLLLPQLIIPRQKQQFLDAMQTGKTLGMTEESLFQAIGIVSDIYEGKSSDPKGDFLKAQSSLKDTLLTMQKLEAENQLPPLISQKLHSFDGIVNLVEETIDTWPAIFGFEGKRTYLVLFQNNMELRPGGGFIGSYGTVSFDNGKMSKLEIHDVYDADGHLKEKIPPPYGLQRYLGVSHWFLRDSNFDTDFLTNAKQAAFFLNKETGETVDGVVAIDTTFLKNIIGVLGSVDVADYKTTVTPDNFYLLTETNAEKNFFPGSTQKKDFLRSLTNALFDKLAATKPLPYEKFIQLLFSSIQEKDLLFAFSDNGIQNAFTVNGLSSSLWDGREAKQNTEYDYAGVVDANVGTNKANYYVSRSLNQEVTIDPTGGVQSTIEATYNNTSNRASAFGGDYKDYVQFIIPANANLTSVTIDHKQVQTSPAVTDPAIFSQSDFIPPKGLEVSQTLEQQKRIVGFFFIVPQGVTRTFAITYVVPSEIDKSAVVYTYSLHVFKQPGAGDDSYQLTLAYPNNSSVVTNDKDLNNVGGKMFLSGQLQEDRTILATFTKK